MKVINPATGEFVREYSELTVEQVSAGIDQTHAAFNSWRRTGFGHRAELMNRAARVLRERKDEFASLMTIEMGKPISQAIAEVEKCAWVCEYYAENAEAHLEPEVIGSTASRSFVAFQPIGVVLAVMPWNFPFWQVFRFAAPALMAGNAGVLKHASNVPGCALAIEEVFHLAGFPDHLFKTLLIGSSKVDAVIEHPLIKAATLTGSTPAGRAVAGKAGEMLKKTVMELGGSDPYVILEDADLDLAVPACVTARLLNSGQSCINGKRFIVVEAVREQFEEAFIEEMTKRRAGDPLDPKTEIGPMAREDLRDEVHGQVEQSVAGGARVLLGCEVPQQAGAWYPPSILTDVGPGTPAYDDEIFGPVASIITVEDEAEAIRVANDTVFGLGAAVFTSDLEKGERIAAEELDAGCCFVNDFVRSDPRLPFGGVKESGYGRELSHYGIREFVNIKTVYIR
ncbi:NAD-dependent succinate-semialdehyde dehydrogenase [Candidatus Zixiibacteriota bacterium]